MDYNQKTVEAYNSDFDRYAAKKTGVEGDSNPLLKQFESYLKGKDILEIGFGLGQDAQWFITHGYNYTGIDPTLSFNQHLREDFPEANLVQEDIRKAEFPKKNFDGIWAMASLLHFNDQDLQQILSQCSDWLRPSGVLFVSIKEGEGEITRDDGRYFNLFSKERFLEQAADHFSLINFSTNEARAYNTGRENWLNFYLLKK